MAAFDVRDLIKADAAASATSGMFGSKPEGPTRAFHPLAERIAAMPVKPTLSPVMIEGLVRLLDALAVLGAGGLIYWLYAAGKVEDGLPYQVTLPALVVGALGTFQALQLYHVGALRNFVPMAVKLMTGWTMLFLVALAMFFFLKVGEQVSRGWLLGFYATGAAALLGERLLVTYGVRRLTRVRPPRTAHSHRRRRRGGRGADPGAGSAARHGASGLRRLRRPQRRPLARSRRGLSEARHHRRPRRVRAAHQARSRDLHPADLGRGAAAHHAAQALGAADRYPPLGAYVEAALPPALLFLSRRGAGARRLRPADRRLGHRAQMAVRQARRDAGADRALRR